MISNINRPGLPDFKGSDNIKIINNKEFIPVVKHWKLINHNLFKFYFNDNSTDINTYYKELYYYENGNKILIYFRKYYIDTFKNTDKIDNTVVSKLLGKTIQIIKNKSIKIQIKYIRDILGLNQIEPSVLEELNSTQIDFSVRGQQLYFYIKYNLFYNCDISKVNNIFTKLLELYNTIRKNKRKIIFFGNSSIEENHITQLIGYLFKRGYWLDFYGDYKDKNRIRLSHHYISYLNYDIIIYSDCFTLFCENFNCDMGKIIKNKIVISLPGNFSWDIRGDVIEFLETITEMDNKFLYYGKRGIDLPESHLSGYQWMSSIQRTSKYMDFFKNIPKIGQVFDNIYLLPDKDTDTILSKIDFYKIFNLNSNQKLITIFLEWPHFVKKHMCSVNRPGLCLYGTSNLQ